MSVFFKTIKSSDFNDKYKNRLRDFYVYQFKSNNKYYISKQKFKRKKDDLTEVYVELSESEIDNNKPISPSMIQTDSQRLQVLMSPKLGVEWYEDFSKNTKRCISIDSRLLKSNPFFELYRTCHRSSNIEGANYALMYLLALFFRSCSEYSKTSNVTFTTYGFSKKTGEKLITLVQKAICRRYVNRKHFSKEITYENIPVKERIIDFAVIDNSMRNSYYPDLLENSSNSNSTSGGKMKELYNIMLLNRLRLSLNESGELEICDDTKSIYRGLIRGLFSLVRTENPNGKNDKTDLGEEQFYNKLNELFEYGILTRENGCYNFSEITLPDFDDFSKSEVNFKYRFCEMIKFFTETMPLGVIGFFIERRLDNPESNISLKHNYLLRALNDYNIIDILYAIENKEWLSIEYRSAKPIAIVNKKNKKAEQIIGKYRKIICYPLEIRESTTDGQQCLLCYLPASHSLSSLRIEFIDNIYIGTLEKFITETETVKFVDDDNIDGSYIDLSSYFDKEINVAKERINYIWGASFHPIACDIEENTLKTELYTVEILLKYDENKEKFIPRRIERELASSKEDANGKFKNYVREIDYNYNDLRYGKCIKLVINVIDYQEAVKWARTFTRRLVSIKINGKEDIKFWNDIDDIVNTYYSVVTFDSLFINNENDVSDNWLSEKDVPVFRENKNIIYMHNFLFNEFFSTRMEDLGDLLFKKILKNNEPFLKEKKEKIKRDYTKNMRRSLIYGIGGDDEELLSKQIDYFFEYFVCNENSITVSPKFNYKNIYDLFPLTNIEIQWLNNILQNDYARVFLTDSEILQLNCLYTKRYAKNGCGEIFDFSNINCFNQYCTAKEYQDFNKSCGYFRLILCAIKNKKNLKILYRAPNNEPFQGFYSPIKIEYSKRDDIFRIYAINENQVRILNLERILNCEKTGESFCKEDALYQINSFISSHKKEIVIKFKNNNDTPDRILNEFSPWKKECTLDEKTGMFAMILWYDEFDTFEIAVRLLGYGRNIFIVADGGSVRQIVFERLKEQKELFLERKFDLPLKERDCDKE